MAWLWFFLFVLSAGINVGLLLRPELVFASWDLLDWTLGLLVKLTRRKLCWLLLVIDWDHGLQHSGASTGSKTAASGATTGQLACRIASTQLDWSTWTGKLCSRVDDQPSSLAE